MDPETKPWLVTRQQPQSRIAVHPGADLDGLATLARPGHRISTATIALLKVTGGPHGMAYYHE